MLLADWGSSSSVAEPVNVALGIGTVWSGPASTTGAAFWGVGVGVGNVATVLKLTVIEAPLLPFPAEESLWCCDKRVSSWRGWCPSVIKRNR